MWGGNCSGLGRRQEYGCSLEAWYAAGKVLSSRCGRNGGGAWRGMGGRFGSCGLSWRVPWC